MEYVLCSPAGSPDPALLPPPPPVADRSPEDLPPLRLLPPPPLGSSRPERLGDRLAGGARPAGCVRRTSSDGAGGGRGRRRSAPRRSPSPAPPKRSRLESSWSKYKRSGSGGRCTSSRSPNRPHSGYRATSNCQDKNQREGLMTYKQFTQVLEDDVSPAQTAGRYGEYRTEYITTQKRAYFDLNKNEDWLKDMYHPTNLLTVIERRNDFCKTVAKNLILDLRTGTLDLGPGVTADAASKSGNGNDGCSDDDADCGEKKRMHGRGPRKEIKSFSTALKAHPISSQYRRVQTDINQTLALVKKLDSEKGIVGNILSTDGKPNVDKSHVGSMGPIVIVRGLNTVKGLEGVELLDTLLTYLWRVHGVDYYGMSEMRYAKGFRHVRAENKSASMSNIGAADWEKKLDSFWEGRLMSGEDPLVVLTAKDKIDAATVEVLEPYVRKVRDEKYVWTFGCGAKGCAKLFHAPEFVHKHLKLKHPDLVSVLTSRVEDDIYFQNYMTDPDAPGGIPVMQRSVPDTMKRRPEQQMSGAPGGRGSNAPPVPEFFPSPLLIPVPGAGPLGPFVPAPPEIAMQIMHQGRPGANGADRRKPSLLGPLIPMYPSFPLGSRIFRSYNDLDAAAEEVIALDFRSL